MGDDAPKTPEETKDPMKEARSRGGLLFVLLGILLAMAISQAFLDAGMVDPLRYDEVLRMVEAGHVEGVVLTAGEVRGTYREDRPPPPREPAVEGGDPRPRPVRFRAVRVEDPDLIPTLTAFGVRIEGQLESSWSRYGPTLLTFLLIGGLFLFMSRGLARGGPAGALSFGKSRGKVVAESEVKVTFDDVAGAEEAKQELREVVEFLQKPERFRRLGAKFPKGILLVGPPGTGKTLMARAVAGEAEVPFISIGGSEFVEMFVGVGAARVRDLFEQAEKSAPCIVFIDELDALGRARSSAGAPQQNEERESTLNQLLVEMDGFEPHEAVLLLAATNRPEVLDPALLRPGRFDRQVLIDRPDRRGREAILKVHVRGVRLDDTVDLEVLARRTPGFAGADLANLVNEAALLAARRDAESVSMTDFSAAIDRVVAGLEKSSRLMSDAERERIATHEVGHALTAVLSKSGDRVHKISIVPRGLSALGYTMQLPDQEKYLMTEPEIRSKLRALLGGRAAEEIVYGEPSTGAQNDLQKATEIARAMITEYGMGDELGPVFLGRERRSVFLGGGGAGGTYGEAVADRIDREVRAAVERALEEAKAMLQAHRSDLDRIVARLLEVEQLEGEELDRLLADVARPAPAPVLHA